jgi:hypothetical protein
LSLEQRCFGYGPTTVRVTSSEPCVLAWLDEFLCPPFEPRSASVPDERVRFDVDERRYAELAGDHERGPTREVPCFALDTQVVHHRARVEPDRTTAFDARLGCFYVVSPDGVAIVAHPRSEARRTGLMRVLREIATQRYRRGSRVLELHAAALAVGERGVLLAGPKGAGKTTLLVHTLACPEARGRLLANDRVFVALGEPPVVHGVPTIVSVRPETLEMLPRLLEDLPDLPRLSRLAASELGSALATHGRHPGGRRIRLSPLQLCRGLGVEAAASAPLSVVVFCEVAPDASGFEVTQLCDAAAREALAACRYGAVSGARDTVFARLGTPQQDEDALLDELAARVPSFSCRVGPDAYRRDPGARALLDRVLA